MINIVLTFDDAYSQHAAVVIASVCCNNPHQHFRFYVISDYVSENNKKHLSSLVEDFTNDIFFVKLDKFWLDKFPIGRGTANTYVTLATYYRLFIPQLIPQNIDKVLYLDCDVVVNGALDGLWNFQIEDFYAVGLEEQRSLVVDAACRLKYQVDDSYFNAGVLVLNLKKIRTVFSINDFVDYILQNTDIIKFHDQDVLNRFFHAHKAFFPLKYNVMDVFLFRNCKIPSRYKSEQNDIFKPVIIHYSGPIKPWHKESKNPYTGLYYKYLKLTYWKDYTPIYKYSMFKDKIIYELKKMTKNILEIVGLRYYSYIKIKV